MGVDPDVTGEVEVDDPAANDRGVLGDGDAGKREPLGQVRDDVEVAAHERGLCPGRAQPFGVDYLVDVTGVPLVEVVAEVRTDPEDGPAAVVPGDQTRRIVCVDVAGQPGDRVGVLKPRLHQHVLVAAVARGRLEPVLAGAVDPHGIALDDHDLVALRPEGSGGPPADTPESDDDEFHVIPYHIERQKGISRPGRGSDTSFPVPHGTAVMRVTFLGTSGAVPTTARSTSALLVEREGDRLLFDCGEGTQRQMMRFSTGFDVGHIFLTHLHGDHVLGLPGLTQTFDFNDRERALAVHAPAGTRSRVERLLAPTGNAPSYPVRVNQVEPGDVALAAGEYEVRAFGVNHRTDAVGYALVEAERRGRFDREKAEEELGLAPGPKYSKLHRGEPVEHEGRTIEPESVVGPPRPGRRLVYTGDTRPVEGTVRAAEDADLLVHDATFADDRADRARKTAHATASEAAEVANRAGATRLALTHISTRYAGQADRLSAEAREVFEGERAFLPDDGVQAEVPFPDADREFTLEQLP